jgi:hypothetical protein
LSEHVLIFSQEKFAVVAVAAVGVVVVVVAFVNM